MLNDSTPRRLRWLPFFSASLLAVSVYPVTATPTAVNDSFSGQEDTQLTVAGAVLLNAKFEPVPPVPFATQWSYLNSLPNTTGTNYPTDGAGRAWNHPSFNTATSTVGPWGVAPLPLIGSNSTGINYYNNNPTTTSVVLTGTSSVTTYLLRSAWTLTAAQAATAQWTARYLIDDGVILYINGVEAFRINMAPGAATPLTLASNGGNEDAYLSSTVDLSGKLQAGVNTIAVELHQSALSTDAAFDMTLSPADANAFTYVPDGLGTAAGGFNSGTMDSNTGVDSTGAAHVHVGDRTPNTAAALPISGAWTRTLNVATAGTYNVAGKFRGTVSSNYDVGEFIEEVFKVDSTRYGTVAADATLPGSGISLYRFVGNGNGTGGGESLDTGWQTFSQNVTLTAGAHSLTFGLYNNTSSGSGNAPEFSDLYLDDVTMTQQGGGGIAGVLLNDTGTGALTAVKDTDPLHGVVAFSSNGSFVYTPAPNYFGPDSFIYHAVDSTGSSAPATVSLTVTPVNDPPAAQNDTYSTNEDTGLTVNAAAGVLANDSDPDGDTLTAVLRVTTPNGSLTLSANGSFTYTPNLNFNGTDSFTYRATDGTINTADRTVAITVNPVNDAPITAADSYRTPVNTPLNVNLTSTAGQPTTTVVLVAPGSPVPAGDPAEADLLLWRYLDDGSNQGTAWRDPAFNDSGWATGKAELGYGDIADGRPERSLVGFGPDANAKFATTYFRTSFMVVDKSTLGTMALRLMRDDAAVVYLNGTEIYRDSSNNGFLDLPQNPAYNYYPNGSISGTDEALLVNLSAYLAANATQYLVEGTNGLAVEVHQGQPTSSDISMDIELTAQRTPYAGVLANDLDPDSGATVTAQLVTGTSHGTLTLNANGTFLYTPVTSYIGPDSFVYKATDGTLSSGNTTVTLSVVSLGNSAPAAADDAWSTNEDTPLNVAAPGVLANDSDPENTAMTAQLLTGPLHGTLTLNTGGSFTYTPAANYNGPDSFTYRARDAGNAPSAAATVSLTVTAVNDLPAGVADSYGTNPGQTLTVSAAQGVLNNDTDADGNALTAVLVAPPASGTLSLAADGSFTYAPPAGFSGIRTFTYRASDGTGTSGIVTVTISINGVPVAVNDAFTTVEDTFLTVTAANGVLKNDSDPESSPLTAQVGSLPVHGTLTLNADGSFSYSPATNYAGPDSFSYSAFDGVRSSVPATVSLTMTPVNDEPIAQDDSYKTAPNQTLTVTAAAGVLKNDSDAEGSALVLTLLSNPVHGTLTMATDGSFVYVPALDFSGTDSFTYKISDGVFSSAAATVEITVAQTGNDIVINEIMYRPGGTFPEVTNQEFIELFNRGTTTIDLTGWQIDSGVSFNFPSGRTMAPGAYLVVAANVAAFQTAHPGVTNVIGGWLGTLSNSGEKISLMDAAGISLDSVHYAAEGDWAQRVREMAFNGWDWSSLANGGGRSLELRNPQVSNDNGQNWAASQTVGGTPGAVNGALTSNITPIIKAVKHSPAVPTSTDRVLISCELNDESPVGALTATLFWRDATTTSPGPFQSLPMSADGKGGWFAPLDPRANLAIVEFYISASDGTTTRTWPAPTSEGQNANCQYQVDNAAPSTTAEMYRLILTAAENQAFSTVSQSSDRQFNHTLVVTRGAENSIRYRSAMRIRGNSSRSYIFKPLRISLPADDDLDGATKFNLNPRSPFLQYFGMRLFEASGLRAPHAIPADVRRNGVKPTTSSPPTPDYGLWVRMEDISGELVSNHWPLTGDGGVYKKGRPDEFWRATQTPPPNPDSLFDGWTKQNNSAANDWTDVTGFFSTWQAAAAPHFPGAPNNNVSGGSWDGTAFTSAEVTSVETVADLDQWARWFAVMTILEDNETNVSNGQDDDYGAYFEPKVIGGTLRRRLQFIPHDLDTILGLGDSPLSYNSQGLFDMTDDGSVFTSLLPLFGNNSTAGNAAFRTKYFNALRDLLGTVFNADTTANPNPPFYSLVDQHLGNWVPAPTRTAIKDFVRQRRTYLLGLIGAGSTTPPPGISNATLTSSHSNLFISEVLANNVAAHTNGGLFPDVVELRNTGASAIDLSGKSITDDPLDKIKFRFPAGTTLLPAGGFLILYADSVITAPGIHLLFGLDADGDAIYLYDSVASGQALLDSVVFGLQAPDLSIGRTGAALDTWALCTPSIGAPNAAVAALASPAGLRINEWLGNADYRAENDFIELYNPAAQPAALGGMSLTDNFIDLPGRGTLPALSFMGANSFAAFKAKGSNATPGNASELPFGLDATMGSVALIGANGTIVDRGDTIAQFRDTSTGHLPDGTGGLVQLSPPSPGFSNAALPDSSLDVVNFLRITEMMYNPANTSQSEYVEFRNMSDQSATPVTLDISGVTFKNGITYAFPPGTLLAPAAYFIIVGEQPKFAAQFPAVPVGGVFTGKLDNSGERIRFDIPANSLAVLDFNFSDGWYPSTDGGGYALQIIDATASPAQWDKKSGWQAAPPNPGTLPAFGVNAGLDTTGPVATPVPLDGSLYAGAFTPSTIALAWTKDSGPGTVTFTTADYQDANATFSQPGIYVLRLTATAPGPLVATDLVTVVVQETFTSWAARVLASQSAANRGPLADPDSDGVSNVAEFVLNADPLNPASTGLPQPMNAGGRLAMTWQRNKAADSAIQIIPQLSANLQSWTEGAAVIDTVLTGSTTTAETWQATEMDPSGSHFRRYMRLKVVMP